MNKKIGKIRQTLILQVCVTPGMDVCQTSNSDSVLFEYQVPDRMIERIKIATNRAWMLKMRSFQLIRKLIRTSPTQVMQKRQVIWNAKKEYRSSCISPLEYYSAPIIGENCYE
jgi:hypothetical protein